MPKIYEIKDFGLGYDDSLSDEFAQPSSTQECVYTDYSTERGAISKDLGERYIGGAAISGAAYAGEAQAGLTEVGVAYSGGSVVYPLALGEPVQLIYEGSMWASGTGQWINKRLCVAGGIPYAYCRGNLFIPLNANTAAFETASTNYLDVTHYINKFIITDGVNNIKKWDGFSFAIDDLAGAVGNYKSKCLEVYRNRLFMGNTTESGTSYESRIRWSDLGLPETWTSSAYNDVIDKDGDEVIRLRKYGDALIIFKRNSVHKAIFTGGNLPFEFTAIDVQTINNAPWSIAQSPAGLIFLNEEGLQITDGMTVKQLPADQKVTNLLKRLYVESMDRCYAIGDDSNHEYNLLLPLDGSETCNHMVTWNWKYDTWKVREIASNVLGLFTDAGAGTWEGIDDYYGYELIGFNWNSSELYPGSKKLIFGKSDGYVMEKSLAYNSCGSAYNSHHITPWMDFDANGSFKEVVKIQPKWKGIVDTNVTVSYKKDGDSSWTDLTTDSFDSTGVVEQPFLYLRDTGRKWKLRFANNNADESFTLYGCKIYYEQRGER